MTVEPVKRIVVAIAVAALSAATVTYALNAKPATSDMSTTAALLIKRCATAEGLDDRCVTDRLPELVPASSNLAAFAEAVVADIGDDEALISRCHSTMHIIGRYDPDRLLTEAPSTTALTACGSGLMHGIVEHHDLPAGEQEAAAVLAKICNTFDENSLRGDCMHSAGHALIFNQQGAYDWALRVCEVAFRAGARGCNLGVLMMIRDEASKNIAYGILPKPAAEHSFDGYTAPCRKLPAKYHTDCVRGFSSSVFEADPSALPAFLTWCAEEYPDAAATCEHDTGVTLGISYSADPTPVLGLCDGRTECIVGMAEGLVGFVGADTAEANVCRAVQAKYPDRAEAWCTAIDARLKAGVSEPVS